MPPQGNLDYPFPTGQKRSDFAPFSDIGIPYIYFESNNWENGYPEETLTAYSELLYTLLKTDIVEQP